jgi:UDP-glucose:(heptosyl)LPS alpha-1,3-glucosyltransferase
MVPFYGAADLFVFPTLYEAFGLVITEAMASGLPVLVSASAGAAEDLIRDGQDGILISDPHDSAEVAAKIRMITDSWELRTTLSSLGRLRVLQTGWEQYGSQLLKVYDEALARKKAEGG